MSSPESTGRWPRRAAVVGGGTMGAGFAQLLAVEGLPVAVADASPELAGASVARVKSSAREFEQRGLLGTGGAERVAGNVRSADSIGEAVGDAELIIEAVFEDPDVKHQTYEEVEAASTGDAVIATNTSAIPIGDLAAGLEHPGRFLGTHWFNPPQWVPCVEVIPSEHTAERVVEQVHAFLARIGKRPVEVGDSAGFVANRIQFAMFKEAVSCVSDGVAGAEEVDEVVRSSFGFRLPFFGPFAIADMAGLDIYAGAYEALERDLGPRFAAPEQLLALLEEGRSGTKSGGGFLDIPADSIPATIRRRDASYVALADLLERLGEES